MIVSSNDLLDKSKVLISVGNIFTFVGVNKDIYSPVFFENKYINKILIVLLENIRTCKIRKINNTPFIQ